MQEKQNRKAIYTETLRKQEAKRREIRSKGKNIQENGWRNPRYAETLRKQEAKRREIRQLRNSKSNISNESYSTVRTGYIYCIVDSNSVARYIGQTVRNPVTRFNEHMNGAVDPTSSSYNTQFSQAIRTYGIDNFSLLILESEIPESDLDSKEIAYISHYNTFHGGYNGTRGGGRVKTYPKTEYIPPTTYNTPSSNYNSSEYEKAIKNTEKIREKIEEQQKYDADINFFFAVCCIGVIIFFIIAMLLG